MNTLSRFSMALAIAAITIGSLAGCGGKDDPAAPPPPPPPPPDPGVVEIVVRNSVDSLLVGFANVVLYQAETNEALLRGMTNVNGTISFSVDQGNYYLNVSAQGFESAPPKDISAVPFFVSWEDTTGKGVLLTPLSNPGNAGYVMGYVQPATNNFLIVARSQTSLDAYSTASGPDGFFVLFNLPYDTYAMDALKSGYQMDGPVSATISGVAEADTVSIPVSTYRGSLLTGSVTFLAITNSTVDITLLDPATGGVIPGLTVMSDVTGLNYRIDGIPDGDYLAWASLRNDGYVIDPDWLFKNPGGLDISFVTSETQQLDFSVTGAISLVSPTNPADVTVPAMAASQVPVFRWTPYPSTKEYFIEVKDFNGNVLWGGINSDGTVNHAFIGANVDNVVYNFDNQPGIPALQPGEIYQWRLWADKGTAADSFVEQLISASEDLRGIFQVPANP